MQDYFDIREEKQKHKRTPDLSKLRPVLFWDTDINSIDWQQYKEAVIRRVFERGNDTEKQEIIRFYSQQGVDLVLNNNTTTNAYRFQYE